jgi:hypothetical protein
VVQRWYRNEVQPPLSFLRPRNFVLLARNALKLSTGTEEAPYSARPPVRTVLCGAKEHIRKQEQPTERLGAKGFRRGGNVLRALTVTLNALERQRAVGSLIGYSISAGTGRPYLAAGAGKNEGAQLSLGPNGPTGDWARAGPN